VDFITFLDLDFEARSTSVGFSNSLNPFPCVLAVLVTQPLQDCLFTLLVADQEMDSTGKFFMFASSATSFTSDASPQNGFVANFDNKTLCIGGSISSSSDCGDCAGAAPALATKAKKILKRMKGSTPFLGKTKKMNAFGSLDDGDIDQ